MGDYRVEVHRMTESGERYSYYVILYRPDLSPDALPWDDGILDVYMSRDVEKANYIAEEYAKFFKVTPLWYKETE